jgi:2-methylcitrate dehydratase PrpD
MNKKWYYESPQTIYVFALRSDGMDNRINPEGDRSLESCATGRLADFISGLEYEGLPSDVIEKTKETILDYVGALLAGCSRGSILSERLIQLIMRNGGTQEATIIGQKAKVPVINAALCNGVLSHVVELDDGHRIARGHPGVTVISAALATAEYANSSGRELITAIVAGYDIFVRVASSVNPSHLERGFHTTGTCGALAASAAASKLLGLSSEETANALGLAGIQAAGLLEVTVDGQMAKPLHPGKAAQAGVLSALLAKDGVKGPKTVIEGIKGFAKAMSDEFDYELIEKGINEVFHINSCYIKLYPSCRHTHSPIDAVLDLIKENDFNCSDIDDILIRTYPTAISFVGEIYKPKTSEEAKFSAAYCVCAALARGEFGLRELEPDCLRDPLISALTDKVTIEPDPSLESSYPKVRGAEAHITLNDGRRLSKRIDLPKGEVENPISRDELIRKFKNCTDSHFNNEKRNKVVNQIMSIELIDYLGDLVSLLKLSHY